MASERPLLELRGVTAGYDPAAPAIHGLDLEVLKGEVSALVSLDMGGGKSTALKAAAGLLRPFEGQVLFDGEDVYEANFRDDQRFRSRCAVVLEGGALMVNMSIWDNVAFPLRYHGVQSGRELKLTVDRLLGQCGFNEDPQAYPWQTSDRGQKLAAFARALARDPSLVIVDRFFEGLEIPEWRRLFELVMELNQHQGVSWLLVSELDPAIFQVAERVAVIEEGDLLAYDYRRKLYKDPRIKDAFEAGATRGQKTRTQRADRERLRQIVADHSSERFEPLSVESGSRLGSESALDEAPLDATIAIDGILPAPPAPLDLSGSGEELEEAEDGLDVTIYMGSSDERQALPKRPRPRLRAPGTPPGQATVQPKPPRKRGKPSLREATTIDQPPRPPAEELAATQFYEPPSGDDSQDPSETAAEEAPSTDEGQPLPAAPGRRRARGLRPTVDLGATYVGAGSSSLHDRPKKADQRTVEMEAPSVDELEETPTASKKDQRTVEMEAPSVDELEETPAPTASKKDQRTVEMKAPSVEGEEASPPLAETKRLDPPPGATEVKGRQSKTGKRKRPPASTSGTGKRKRPGTKGKRRPKKKQQDERTVEMPAPSLADEDEPPPRKVELQDPAGEDEEA